MALSSKLLVPLSDENSDTYKPDGCPICEPSMYIMFQQKQGRYQSLQQQVVKMENWFEMVNSEYFKTQLETFDAVFRNHDMTHVATTDYCEFIDHLLPNGITIDAFARLNRHCNWRYTANPKRHGSIPARWQNLAGDFYQPFVIRYKRSVLTGQCLKAEALCPYCPCPRGKFNENFHSIRNADYLHHVTKTHMVYSNGTEMEMPHIGRSWSGETTALCGKCMKHVEVGMGFDLTQFIKHSWKHAKTTTWNQKQCSQQLIRPKMTQEPFERRVDSREWLRDGLTRLGHAKEMVVERILAKGGRRRSGKKVQFSPDVSKCSENPHSDSKRAQVNIVEDL